MKMNERGHGLAVPDGKERRQIKGKPINKAGFKVPCKPVKPLVKLTSKYTAVERVAREKHLCDNGLRLEPLELWLWGQVH